MTKSTNKSWREKQNKHTLAVLKEILATETTNKVYGDKALVAELKKRGVYANTSMIFDLRQENDIPATFIRKSELFAKQAKGKK